MKRWFWKRWVWAGVFGVTAAVGLAVAAGGGKDAPAAPHKVGDVVTLKFQGGPEKKVKVLKTEKQPDGSYLSEVKDTKTGEVFSLLDKSHLGPEKAKASESAKTSTTAKTPTTGKAAAVKPPEAVPATKGKAQPPLPVSTPVPGPIKDAKASVAGKPVVAAAPAPMPPEPPEKKPGLLSRVFGSKKPTPPLTPAMPVTMPVTTPPSTGMPITTAKPAAKPAVKPAPMHMPPTSVFESGPAAGANPTPRPSAGTATIGAPKLFPDKVMGTTEPPRVSTPKPAAPPPVSTPKPAAPPLVPPAATTPQPVATTPQPVATKPPVARPPVKPFASPPSAADSELSRPIRANTGAATRPVEPPRTLPMNPVTPPTTALPAPVSPPTRPPMITPPPLPIPTAPVPVALVPVVPVPVPAAPATAAPVPLPIPSLPATAAPVVPAVPTPGGLPTIPVPPGGMSAGRSAVMQAGYSSVAAMALVQDIQPHVVTLRTAVAPSMRVLAARALSGGRHASTDTVKSILFIACTSDPSPFVRACCIDELCKLGYFDAAFMAHLHKSTGDPAEEVRTAAKEALGKMTPQK